MYVTMTAIADAANVSQEGKLNVIGIFDSVNARKFPAQHPSMAFAFRILVEWEDRDTEVEIDVKLIDADSRALWGASATMQIGSIPAGEFTHLTQVINLQGVVFPKAGRYRFRIKLSSRDEPFDTVFQVVVPRDPPQQA